MNKKTTLSYKQKEKLLTTLKIRFEANMERHKTIQWKDVLQKLADNAKKLWAVYQMEITGGEPDVVILDKKSGDYFFCDCSAESPKERRSYCYDHEALEKRKEHKPKDSALHKAAEMGIELMTEEEYRKLQQLGAFDLKTSSWIQTAEKIRTLGGALFCDRRYDTVFTYHNGAESYYAARGFRGILKL